MQLVATRPRWGLVLISGLCGLCSLLVFTWRWHGLLQRAGTPVGLWRLAWCRTGGASVAAVLPNGKLVAEPLRMLWTVREGASVPAALATVTIDRTLEIAASAPFAALYMVALLRAGVPEAGGLLATVVLGTIALGIGGRIALQRLRLGHGVVTAFARLVRLDRLAIVRDRLHALEEAEALTPALVTPRSRLIGSFTLGLLANLANFAEFQLLLWAFGLPSSMFAVMAAIAATELSRVTPVPAAVGALEGGQVWLFSMLGYAPDVGLAIGFVLRLRELLWLLPGGCYVVARGWRGAANVISADGGP